MKEGFTFKWASLKFLRKVIFKNFGGGGGGGVVQKRAGINIIFCFLLQSGPSGGCLVQQVYHRVLHVGARGRQ